MALNSEPSCPLTLTSVTGFLHKNRLIGLLLPQVACVLVTCAFYTAGCKHAFHRPAPSLLGQNFATLLLVLEIAFKTVVFPRPDRYLLYMVTNITAPILTPTCSSWSNYQKLLPLPQSHSPSLISPSSHYHLMTSFYPFSSHAPSRKPQVGSEGYLLCRSQPHG